MMAFPRLPRRDKIEIYFLQADLNIQLASVSVLILCEPVYEEASLLAPCSFKKICKKGLVKATRSPCRQCRHRLRFALTKQIKEF